MTFFWVCSDSDCWNSIVHGEALGDGVRGIGADCRGEISVKESVMSMSESRFWSLRRVELVQQV